MMLTAQDLPARRFTKPAPQAPGARDLVDAWFSAWAIPATVWLRFLQELHAHVRPR